MSETRFLESIKMAPLTLQKDARASSYSVSHHYQTQRKSVSLLWADKTEHRAEKQTDRTAVAQSTSLNSWHICHRGWNIHNNRQESSITGSETHCADGCMGWVRQMRLRLLMAARCLNPSLITSANWSVQEIQAARIKPLSQLHLTLACNQKKSPRIHPAECKPQQDSPEPRRKRKIYRISYNNIALEPFSWNTQQDSYVNRRPRQTQSHLLAWLTVSLFHLRFCLFSLVCVIAICFSISCSRPIRFRARNCKALHQYVPFCWFRVTKTEIKR